MIELSDQNMAINPQCYKDREDYSRRSSSLLCGCKLILSANKQSQKMSAVFFIIILQLLLV